MKQKPFFLLAAFGWSTCLFGQSPVSGVVLDAQTRQPVSGATVSCMDSSYSVLADAAGCFRLVLPPGSHIRISATGYETKQVKPVGQELLQIGLYPLEKEMEGVVISGTLKAVRRTESPVAVEVYTPQFLKKNPAPGLFESLQNINGVRPQLNCSVCNTGDIHINGLEGPYTMIAIDGMPVISSLASVYGLYGIPAQLIERVEIVKGPASGLYGAEAIGGLINIITKSPEKAPAFTANLMSTSWQEHAIDAGIKFRAGRKISSLLGIHYYNDRQREDKNRDQFTDVALQHRISVFNKLRFTRKQNREASLAARYFYEDRWGGDLRWTKQFRGTDSIYGESIYTSRWELFGVYQLPVQEKFNLSYSATGHMQDSYYGDIPFFARQLNGFFQLTWDKKAGPAHSLLAGISTRLNRYDDNSTATRDTLTGNNRPERSILPGLFLQDEWQLHKSHLLLLGIRADHHPVHKGIFTPRLAWKWKLRETQYFRLNAGTGFRVVNLFTEEHAALTGARAVEIQETLRPEKSYNVNLNYTWQLHRKRLTLLADISTWYSYFSNQILPDYDADPNKIIYKNLDGSAASKGITINLDLRYRQRLSVIAGITLQQVQKTQINDNGQKIRISPVLTEKWSGTWAISYSVPASGWTFDYTGNVYGPMRLPLVSVFDPRPGRSPVWSLQNIQCTKKLNTKVECFAGIKNLLNWTPAKNIPFLIARSGDPFDKQIQYEQNGQIRVTPDNPYGLSFDPSYIYAPNQGRRVFAGLRFIIR